MYGDQDSTLLEPPFISLGFAQPHPMKSVRFLAPLKGG